MCLSVEAGEPKIELAKKGELKAFRTIAHKRVLTSLGIASPPIETTLREGSKLVSSPCSPSPRLASI